MRHLTRIATTLLTLFLLSPLAVRADQASSLENKVKAVVLFNFAKYTKWPDATFKDASQPIRICVLGENPLSDIFNSSQAPSEAQGRPFEVKEFGSEVTDEQVGQCQILYWKKFDEQRIKSLKSTFDSKSVLTVSDKESDSSLISFYLEKNRVRFKVKRSAAEKVGLSFSSQLLKLASVED